VFRYNGVDITGPINDVITDVISKTKRSKHLGITTDFAHPYVIGCAEVVIVFLLYNELGKKEYSPIKLRRTK